MDQQYKDFGGKFAKAVVDGKYGAAHDLLAPWLQKAMTPDDLEEMLSASWEDLDPPADFMIDGNSCTYNDLKEPDGIDIPHEPFDAGINADNFRQWMCIQFLPEEDSEFDACCDLWMAVLELDGKPAIGYLETADAD